MKLETQPRITPAWRLNATGSVVRGVLDPFLNRAADRDRFGLFRSLFDRFGALRKPGAHTTKSELGGFRVEIHDPRGGAPRRTILYSHGGGFVYGSPSSHRSTTRHLCAATQSRVIVFDYRLAPEHRYPAALEDALAFHDALTRSDLMVGELVLAGDSAGGALSLELALELRDRGLPMPEALLLLCPWVDWAEELPPPNRQDEDFLLSPRRADSLRRGAFVSTEWASKHTPLKKDLGGLPPVLNQVGERDMLLKDGLALHELLDAAGVAGRTERWESMPHVWHVFSLVLSEADAAMRSCNSFLNELPSSP